MNGSVTLQRALSPTFVIIIIHRHHHSLLHQMAAQYKILIKHNKSSKNLQHNEVKHKNRAK